MEGHNLPIPSYKPQYRCGAHIHAHTHKLFPKMSTIKYMNTLPLTQVKLISYNQKSKHILSHVPSMIYL